MFPVPLDLLFQHIFCQESAEYGEKKHEELPEIRLPGFLPSVVGVVVYFHVLRLLWHYILPDFPGKT